MTSVHGTRSRYVHDGCRCAACRAANAAYHKVHRERLRAALAAGEVEPVHGRYSTYVNYGCRCTACRAASARYVAPGGAVTPPTKVRHAS